MSPLYIYIYIYIYVYIYIYNGSLSLVGAHQFELQEATSIHHGKIILTACLGVVTYKVGRRIVTQRAVGSSRRGCVGRGVSLTVRLRLPRLIFHRLLAIWYVMGHPGARGFRGAGCDPAAAGCRHEEDALVSVYLRP